MKIRMIKKATVFLMAVLMVLATATGAFAVAYYEAGKTDWSSTSAMYLDGGSGNTRYFYFNPLAISGPSGDTLIGKNQSFGAYYSLEWVSGTTGVYALTNTGDTSLLVKGGPTTYLTAQAQALTIDFTNNIITWGDVTIQSINNPGGASQSLTDMQVVKDAGGTFQFSTFQFQHETAINSWLTGGTVGDTKYYSKLEGISAVPEPAEWMLMIIGLGMLGFYLQRRGYLNFDFSPQAAA